MPTKHKCIMCSAPVANSRDGGFYLWCGRMKDDGDYKSDHVCSEVCFLRALVKYAPMPATRRNAQARLLELQKQ